MPATVSGKAAAAYAAAVTIREAELGKARRRTVALLEEIRAGGLARRNGALGRITVEDAAACQPSAVDVVELDLHSGLGYMSCNTITLVASGRHAGRAII